MMVFVSTGRCATKRIAEVLRAELPSSLEVRHQMPVSGMANIVGNLLFWTGSGEKVRQTVYDAILRRYAQDKDFICTDPLISMLIPDKYIFSDQTAIIHVIRNRESFARSFLRYTRQHYPSLVAHNLIPFWQPGLYPFENFFNKDILKKYARIADTKNEWFFKRYSRNPNYRKIDMDALFDSPVLEQIVADFWGLDIRIDHSVWSVRANQTRKD